ncbi:MAG: (Na+)-NQR maturation NqrM [Alcanivoracaceae bacterium]|nr:(Na+)-NQR maturation NqrM [Alcanivoracaceae bacterium]
MLATIIAAVVFIGIVIAAMAVGVIFSNKPIKGSCGGLANVGITGECEICGGNIEKCEEQADAEKPATKALGYDANKNFKV